jgi:hypothetical protein
VLPLDDDDHGPRFAWERVVGGLVVLAAMGVLLAILHPSLLLRDTTTNGGDMGAHVWWPAFLREHWFNQLRISGWAPDWYAGFPAGQFYFPLPAVLIAVLDVALPYNIAFKLVTVSGVVLMPVGAYVFARGMQAPWPAPPAFALASVAYLVQTTALGATTEAPWTIYGGNIASTLAGEFSFTIALALALAFLGTLARALRTGSYLWVPALLLASVALSHIVVGVFAAAGAMMVWLVHRASRTWRVALAIGAVGAALGAVWWLPLFANQAYTTNMRYEKVTQYRDWLFTGIPLWMALLVGAAIVAAGWWRRRTTLVLLVLAVFFGLLFWRWPEHHVWNTRFLPLYLLSLTLLAAMGAVEIARVASYLARGVADWIREGDVADWRARVAATALPPIVDGPPDGDRAATAPEPELPAHLRPGPRLEHRRAVLGAAVLSFLVVVGTVAALVGSYSSRRFLPSWASWNYSGYEAKPAWPEFESIIETMDGLPPGRALWEPSSDIDKYGTTLALELLPYFTDGRIGSMEGLYFESAATVPYHFLTVSELTAGGKASNPVRGLSYGTIEEFDLGVRHLQLLGVRYFMAQSEEAKARADAHDDLRLVAEVADRDGQLPDGWKIYEVADAPLVEGLRYEPVVARVRAGSQSECFGVEPGTTDPHLTGWECAAAPWWRDLGPEPVGTTREFARLDRPFAASGPDAWQRVDIDELADTRFERLPTVDVTDATEEPDRISFRVSRTGVPVVVKASYYPNWEADGADGPYRLAPNLMVVVPTDTTVTLRYRLEPVDWIGRALTLLGILGIGVLAGWRPRVTPRGRRRDGPLQRLDDEGAPMSEPAPALP